MKKVLSLVLSTIVIINLAACGSFSSTSIKAPTSVEADSIVSEILEGITESEAVESTESSEPVVSTEEPKVEAEKPKEPTIEETVLMDEVGVKITAKGISYDNIFGPELKLLIENDSDTNVTVQCRNSSVNGYMVDTMMSADVVSGKKANDTLTFENTALDLAGIKQIADMEFSFHIFNSESWDTIFDSDQIQLKTSIADTYEYSFDDSGDLAYEGNDTKIVVKGLTEDTSIFGPSIVVYIENNGSKGITVQSRDVSINGFMVDAIFSTEVMPGKKAIDTITFMSSDLEDNDITTIEDVELSFHLFDTESWNTITDTDVVKITF